MTAFPVLLDKLQRRIICPLTTHGPHTATDPATPERHVRGHMRVRRLDGVAWPIM